MPLCPLGGTTTATPTATGSECGSPPFDTEDAPRLVAAVFGSVETEPWDAPLVTLPDRDSVRDYLRARFVPLDQAGRLAHAPTERGPLPLPVTKRGALVFARAL